MNSDAQDEQLSRGERMVEQLKRFGLLLSILKLKTSDNEDPQELPEENLSPIEDDLQSADIGSESASLGPSPELEESLREAAQPALGTWTLFNDAFEHEESDAVRRAKLATLAAAAQGYTVDDILKNIAACQRVIKNTLKRTTTSRKQAIVSEVDTQLKEAERCATEINELQGRIAKLNELRDAALATAEANRLRIDAAHAATTASLDECASHFKEIQNVITYNPTPAKKEGDA